MIFISVFGILFDLFAGFWVLYWYLGEWKLVSWGMEIGILGNGNRHIESVLGKE